MPARVHEYDELKLRFEHGGDESCRVVASAPSGEAAARFELPFSELEIENFVLRLSRAPRGSRRMESSEMSEARRFGGQLFAALFQERVRDLYHGALARAEDRGRGLRITLHLSGAPELAHLPWEYLYDEPNFLAISAWTPVVRYLDLPRHRGPLELQPPLRILAMVSSPTDAAALDVARERANLEEALSGLIAAGAIELCWLERASLRALLRELRDGEFHIFHYIGHGLYDPRIEDGLLLLEDEDERGRAVSGRELGTILHDCTSLRLAVLNACEGARSARNDPFAGVAASLVQCEIPAVIAMQFEITDSAAVVFSEGFYEGVAAGFPVDAALAEARKAIYANHNDTEWGTPVLFMRVPDGRIFDIPHPPRLPLPDRGEAERETATSATSVQTSLESPTVEADSTASPVEPTVRLDLIADLAASASAALLLAALLLLQWRLEKAGIGWQVANAGPVIAVLVVAVPMSVWARRTGRLRNPAAAILALALAGLLIDDLLVLRGGGGIGRGRNLAIYASVGIVLSGWFALAAQASAISKSLRGELVSALGALVVLGSLFLEYTSEQSGWYHFRGQEQVFWTLLGLVLLIAVARLTLTNLGASRATGAILMLVGVVVAQRVAFPYNLYTGEAQQLHPTAVGYWAALGGALIIVVGGLTAALSDGRRVTRPG
jgi:hypothetical protein